MVITVFICMEFLILSRIMSEKWQISNQIRIHFTKEFFSVVFTLFKSGHYFVMSSVLFETLWIYKLKKGKKKINIIKSAQQKSLHSRLQKFEQNFTQDYKSSITAKLEIVNQIHSKEPTINCIKRRLSSQLPHTQFQFGVGEEKNLICVLIKKYLPKLYLMMILQLWLNYRVKDWRKIINKDLL